MIYLDENIEVTVNTSSVTTSGLYVYRIFRKALDTEESDTILFIGSTYLKSQVGSRKFDITDIVSEDRWIPASAFATDQPRIIRDYYVQIIIGTNNYLYSNNAKVCLTYRYPNRLSKMRTNYFDYTIGTNYKTLNCLQGTINDEAPILLPHIPFVDTTKYGLGLLLEQNYYNEAESNNVNITVTGDVSTNANIVKNYKWPFDYKMINCHELFSNITTSAVFNTSINGNGYYLEDEADGIWNSNEVEEPIIEVWDADGHSFYYYDSEKLQDDWRSFRISIDGHPAMAGYLNIGNKNSSYIQLRSTEFNSGMITVSFKSTQDDEGYVYIKDISCSKVKDSDKTFIKYNGITCGAVDLCPSNYYLMWQDRAGGMQSQEFSKVSTYSHNVTTSEIISYDNKRHLNSAIVNPGWTINTGWIKEEFYPYYESIFTSPFIALYDAKEDQMYDVILKDKDYTEKTYLNQQRKFFNLTISVENNKKQNILF